MAITHKNYNQCGLLLLDDDLTSKISRFCRGEDSIHAESDVFVVTFPFFSPSIFTKTTSFMI